MTEEFLTSLTELRAVAERLDDYISDPSVMKVHPMYGAVQRNVDDPSYVTMGPKWEAESIEHGFYCTPEQLKAWGPDQFACLDGTVLHKQPDGSYPNPYGATGLKGPGRMGVRWMAKGVPVPESRVIEAVPLFYDEAENLRILGGVRGDTNQPCFIGGFVEGSVFNSVVKEFFEEAVSGSLRVPPQTLAEFHGDEGEQKFQFLLKHDHKTIQRVAEYFKQNFASVHTGPVRADPSRTDDRWVATNMYSGIIELAELRKILNESPFNLDFVAGSDMKETKLHKAGMEFVTSAFSNHGPFLCFGITKVLRERVLAGIPIRDSDVRLVGELTQGIADYLASRAPLTHGVVKGTSSARAAPNP
jgi:hypothetical protein